MTRAVGKWLIWLLVTLSIAGVTYWLVMHRQDVVDWWRLRSYRPPAQIVALADSATMIDRGRDLFYASDPTVEEKDIFNRQCTDKSEQSLVLGCYRNQRIYLYNVTDPRLAGVKEVTAAHEMLHAAYERLDSQDKKRLDAMIQAQLATMHDERLSGLIALYNEQEPGELTNEMHSILGTEFPNLSSELEAYYKHYFGDRSKIVALSQSYEAVFTESRDRIAAYDQKLDSLQQQINANSAALAKQKDTLNAQNTQLDLLRTSDPAAYNQAVPAYNKAVHAYNSLVAQTRNLVADYNNLVQTRNSEAAVQNDLYHSLDSTYQPVTAD